MEEYNEKVRQLRAGEEAYKNGTQQYEDGLAYYTLLDGYYKGYMDVFDLAAALGEDLPGIEYRDYINAPDTGGITVMVPSYIMDAIDKFTYSLPSVIETNVALAQFEQSKADLDATRLQLDTANTELKAAGEQLNATGDTFEQSYAQLEEAENTLETERINGQNTLNENKRQLDDAEIQYQNGIDEYRQGEVV